MVAAYSGIVNVVLLKDGKGVLTSQPCRSDAASGGCRDDSKAWQYPGAKKAPANQLLNLKILSTVGVFGVQG